MKNIYYDEYNKYIYCSFVGSNNSDWSCISLCHQLTSKHSIIQCLYTQFDWQYRFLNVSTFKLAFQFLLYLFPVWMFGFDLFLESHACICIIFSVPLIATMCNQIPNPMRTVLCLQLNEPYTTFRRGRGVTSENHRWYFCELTNKTTLTWFDICFFDCCKKW